MKKNILIVDPNYKTRVSIKSALTSDPRVKIIYEAETETAMKALLRTQSIDLIVINQSLITNFDILPKGRFVVLSSELDIDIFQSAYQRGAQAYLRLDKAPKIVCSILDLEEYAFFIEPSMTCEVIKYLLQPSLFMVKEDLLTPREKEIMILLRKGNDRPTIALQLCISEATLKTHIKNISRKKKLNVIPQDIQGRVF